MTAKSKKLNFQFGEDRCSLKVFERTEPLAIVHALAARLRLKTDEFYITEAEGEDVIPLTCELPDNISYKVNVHKSGVGYAEMEHTRSPTPAPASPSAMPSPPGRSSGSAAQPSITMSSEFVDTRRHGEGGDNRNVAAGQACCLRLGRCWRTDQEEVDVGVDLQLRYSRLATDLANERTLLAWIRTGLAAMRTTFSFYSLKGVHHISWIWACQIAMAATVLMAGISGWHRYEKIKKACFAVIPPQHFGRISIRWFYALVGPVSLIIFSSVVGRDLHSAFEGYVNTTMPASSAYVFIQ